MFDFLFSFFKVNEVIFLQLALKNSVTPPPVSILSEVKPDQLSDTNCLFTVKGWQTVSFSILVIIITLKFSKVIAEVTDGLMP